MTIPGSANPLLLKAPAGGGGEYTIERSVRFNSSDSAYCSKSFASAGNRKTWTWAGWVKRSGLGRYCFFSSGSSLNTSLAFEFDSSDRLWIYNYTSAFDWQLVTTSVYRDPSAWYHIVLSVDTTQGTASNRVRLYVNGSEVTVFTTAAYPSSSADTYVNTTTLHTIGCFRNLNLFTNGYLADVHFIDGQALDPTSFGEFDADTGVWQPKEYTGDYGFVSVADATGALPIYNTTDTHGAVKGTGTRADTNASSLVLALPLVGNADDVSNQINSGSTTKTITASGNAAASSAQSKFYGGSYYFDGTGDSLTVASNADFNFGSDDFTIEFWFYPVTLPSGNKMLVDMRTLGLSSVPTIYTGSGVLFYYTNSLNRITGSLLSTGQWYHIALSRSGTATKMFLNGTQDGSTYSDSVNYSQSAVYVCEYFGGGYASNGYIQDLRIYKGVAKYTTNFTVASGPNNSFHLPFDDNSTAAALGTDTSGNSNTWTVNNISVAAGAGNDSVVDVPTNGTETDTGVGGEVRGNYATLNPLVLSSNGSLSEGNLKFNSSSNYNNARSTIGVTSGKWYAEFTLDSGLSYIGIALSELPAASYGGNTIYGWVYHPNGSVYHNNAPTSYGTSFTTGDIIGLAFDADNRTAIWYKNGSSQGSYSLGSNAKAGDIFFFVGGAAVASYSSNFGQRPFAYTAPSGFKALCTANLPAPVVTKPSEYMDVKLYTGTSNTGTVTVSGLAFSPDLVWVKNRTNANRHGLADTIRGVNNSLAPNRTDGELTTQTDLLTSFNSDGFTVGGDAGQYGWNYPSASFAAWCWDAGSSTVSNTQGSITSQVRANASAGFSIVTYTGNGTAGATVGHGLNSTVQMYFLKGRDDGTSSWIVGGSTAIGFASGNYLRLNTTDAKGSTTSTDVGSPNSSTIYVNVRNNSGQRYVAYCFAPVEGYSAFGSYTGNGSADGPFVYTGFRPRWVMVKNASSVGNWTINDASRDPYNVSDTRLWANLSDAEGAAANYYIDFLSNGFKLRTNAADTNTSAATYVYCAFAESPFAYSRAR